MDKRDLPKVLIVDVNAWREDAAAHTLLDIFRCWDPDKLALVYTSSELPYNEHCHKYFQVGESQIIRSVVKPWMKVGREVENTAKSNDAAALAERERSKNVHKRQPKWIRLAREVVWKLGGWKTPALKKFVEDFDPDIVFVPIFPYAYMGRIQEYVNKIAKKPTVCYLADDNYTYESCHNVFDYIQRFWTRQYVGPLARKSNQMFVIVDKEKEDTDSRFGTDSVILTKSIDFTGKSYQHREPNKPLKFVYTGSMVIGRDKTLAVVADAINKANENGVKAEMYIYSQTEPSDEIRSHIDCGAAHFCGSVPHQEVKRIQEEADVVVFAESLIGKDANAAKLSFSTKITDYVSNGKCVLAIGKEYIAPIDYFHRNDAAIIAHTNEEIFEKVKMIVENPALVDEYGEKAFNCAVRNHEKGMMTERFINTMLKVWRHD